MSHEWTNPARLRDAAGFEGVEMRDLRHYFAVQNLIRGVPMSVVSVWMGHSSIELTVKRYGEAVRALGCGGAGAMELGGAEIANGG